MINGTNKLDTVKQAFRHWRATRTKRGQIPDEYGSRSRDYWGDYTPSKIGSHLGISPIQIKKKLVPVQNTSLQFVEVKRKPTRIDSEFLSNSDVPCSVEIHRPCGSILKINAVPMSRVSKLMLDFLGLRCCRLPHNIGCYWQ
ncbi:hypothetical protein Lste_1126 [Legionella steelei]|uniref:Uncharacterized protein n=1 Tax=Legionella steelei TaxID=947033 RepID=A0A0W0ZFW2_9GAMM|nr:hypothetical protein [Legionella steelei]KTD67968.1 hypothetical protein Lste_1126 [Legionella steelei]